jgi:hypothetical protein
MGSIIVMDNLLTRLKKADELQKRKYPKEYLAYQKAGADWWQETNGKFNEIQDSPETLYTPTYMALKEAHTTLWNLTRADDEYKAINDQFPDTED